MNPLTHGKVPPCEPGLAPRNEDHVAVPVDVFPAHLKDFAGTHPAIKHDGQNVLERLIGHCQNLDLRVVIDESGTAFLLEELNLRCRRDRAPLRGLAQHPP